MADRALTDTEVHELLCEAQALLLNKVVQTQHAQDVLSMAIRDLNVMQMALLSLSEGLHRPQTET